jgi:hypothetical protein
MFTATRLGRSGRFGNGLFQIAATIGMATRHRQEYVFPEWPYSVYFREPLPQTSAPLEPDLVLGQLAFGYLDITIATDPACVIDLRGSFQSQRFFLHVADRIRAQFAPNPSIVQEIDQHYGDLLRRETCIVVVRRGDYADYPDVHAMTDADFYHRAMCLLPPDTTFLVTSDDIAWCREHVRAKHIVYLPQDEWWLNFFVGTMCRHAVISNTTFGWWIAWLNAHPGKRVMAARRWHGPALEHFGTADLIPADWITV